MPDGRVVVYSDSEDNETGAAEPDGRADEAWIVDKSTGRAVGEAHVEPGTGEWVDGLGTPPARPDRGAGRADRDRGAGRARRPGGRGALRPRAGGVHRRPGRAGSGRAGRRQPAAGRGDRPAAPADRQRVRAQPAGTPPARGRRAARRAGRGAAPGAGAAVRAGAAAARDPAGPAGRRAGPLRPQGRRRRGHPVNQAVAYELEQTLHAALADPNVAEEVGAGRLARAASRTGFDATPPEPAKPARRLRAVRDDERAEDPAVVRERRLREQREAERAELQEELDRRRGGAGGGRRGADRGRARARGGRAGPGRGGRAVEELRERLAEAEDTERDAVRQEREAQRDRDAATRRRDARRPQGRRPDRPPRRLLATGVVRLAGGFGDTPYRP